MHPEPISDIDIEAYVDDQLDLARKIAVERHLADNPRMAARVMDDMRARSALRYLGMAERALPETMRASVERLSRRLDRGMRARRLGVAALFGGSATAGAVAMFLLMPSPAPMNETPAYVTDAVMAHKTALIRASMVSQPESQIFDAEEIRRVTKIRVPVLPDGWRMTDVQIFPSDAGPALQLMIRTPKGNKISVFAVHNLSNAPPSPTIIRKGRQTVAYWRYGDISYAMTGAAGADALEVAARDLADNRLD